MKKDEHLEAIKELYKSERNLEMVPAFKYLSVLFQERFINQNEFDFAKQFLFTYENSRTLSDYKSNFLEAIPILNTMLRNNMIDSNSYHVSINQILRMEKDKFLTQLLNAKIISLNDYINSAKSNIVRIIRNEDIPTFGSTTPVRAAIMLTEKYGFSTVMSAINNQSQTIIVERGNNRYSLSQKKGFFQTKRTITDEKNKSYSYLELLKQLSIDYGTL